MDTNTKLAKMLVQLLNSITEEKNNGLCYDKTYIGKILKAEINNAYTVQIHNKAYTNIKSRGNIIYQVGDLVDCLAPQGQMTLLKIVSLT